MSISSFSAVVSEGSSTTLACSTASQGKWTSLSSSTESIAEGEGESGERADGWGEGLSAALEVVV
jgi:hypothetical protein